MVILPIDRTNERTQKQMAVSIPFSRASLSHVLCHIFFFFLSQRPVDLFQIDQHWIKNQFFRREDVSFHPWQRSRLSPANIDEV